jgi:hypothetical protein
VVDDHSRASTRTVRLVTLVDLQMVGMIISTLPLIVLDVPIELTFVSFVMYIPGE